ncbi:glycosyltransferase [uncultured Martelella sp.]|uniref:glycosyltransferase n=1 Tax=uncultured Martelella sp. TaxID=392331 RepID=UPI0029C95D85|nr:glycosyltransferase [uncultured Martelella sp.]
MISKMDGRGGGASVVASQLAERYRIQGHDVTHLNLGSGRESHPYPEWNNLVGKLKAREARRGYRDHNPFELVSAKFRSIPDEFDVVHLHDMSTVLSHAAINWLSARIPVVWTIHDCSPFTAGCLYPGSCERFTATCGNCPQHRSWPLSSKYDRTHALHTRRKKLKSSDVFFTAPSNWMIEMYRKAGWPAGRIQHVSNGVDLEMFRPRDRSKLREKYGIAPEAGPLFLFSAGWLHDSRKGAIEAVNLVRALSDLNAQLILVGRYSDEAALIFQDVDFTHFGFVKSDIERGEIYALCDGALLFSKEENAPLIALESLAVGTPVFGYSSGGIGEIVTSGECGFVAKPTEMKEIMAAARSMMIGEKHQALCAAARRRAEEFYNYDDISRDYLALLGRLMRERK